jgi:hypothetical protein
MTPTDPDRARPAEERPAGFGCFALMIGLVCGYVVADPIPGRLGVEAAALLVSGACGVLAAVGFGIALFAVRQPGRGVWLAWLSLLVNAGVVLVVAARAVRGL